MSSTGLLQILNASSLAYTGWLSNYDFGIAQDSDGAINANGSSTTSTANSYLPGFSPVSCLSTDQFLTSNFSVYNTGATTPYYATFVIQNQTTAGTSNQSANPSSTGTTFTNVLQAPLYCMSFASDNKYNLLYFSATADLILNSPTNPSSSVYNIFLNMNILNQLTPDTSTDNLPWFANYLTSTDGSAPVCDVLLTLSSTGSTQQSAIFTLTAAQVSANSAGNNGGAGTPVSYTTSGGTSLAASGTTLFTINLPISSIFPSISVPSIIYRLTIQLLGYT